MEPHPPADWFEFWVRFFFGVPLGFFVGWHVLGPGFVTWRELLLGGVVFGVAAGWFGDRFWHAFVRWFWR